MKNIVIDKILELFDVPIEEAEQYATEFIELVESKSGILSHSVIEHQIPKIFGSRLKWKSDDIRQNQENKSSATQSAYNSHIVKKEKW